MRRCKSLGLLKLFLRYSSWISRSRSWIPLKAYSHGWGGSCSDWCLDPCRTEMIGNILCLLKWQATFPLTVLMWISSGLAVFLIFCVSLKLLNPLRVVLVYEGVNKNKSRYQAGDISSLQNSVYNRWGLSPCPHLFPSPLHLALR